MTALQTDRQTDTHTDRCDWRHYQAALAGARLTKPPS